MSKEFKKPTPSNPFKSEVYDRMSMKHIKLERLAKDCHKPISEVSNMINLSTYPTLEFIKDIDRVIGGGEEMWIDKVRKAGGKDPIGYSIYIPQIQNPKLHTNPKNNFYQKVRDLCIEKNIDISYIAKISGYAETSIYNFLNFKSVPSQDFISALSKISGDSRNDSYWSESVKKVCGQEPTIGNSHNWKCEMKSAPVGKTMPEHRTNSGDMIPSIEKDINLINSDKVYFLMEDGQIIDVDNFPGKFIRFEQGEKNVLLVQNSAGSYDIKGYFRKISGNRYEVNGYKNILVLIKGHTSLYSVVSYDDSNITIDAGIKNMCIPKTDVVGYFDSSSIKEAE